MTTTGPAAPRPPSDHVAEDIPALLSGELDLDATRVVTDHLRACPQCRGDLVEIAAGVSLLRRLDRLQGAAATGPGVHAPADATRAPVSDLAPRRRRSRIAWMAAAAAALVLVVGGITSAFVVGSGSRGPDARVALTPVSDTPARGSVSMRASGPTESMVVKASLPATPPDRYYEVWLLDRQSGKMLPVGVLAPDGNGEYRLDGSIVGRYNSVDISLQKDDGTTQHSADSVLRAKYA